MMSNDDEPRVVLRFRLEDGNDLVMSIVKRE
jgi:hypothetical protein